MMGPRSPSPPSEEEEHDDNNPVGSLIHNTLNPDAAEAALEEQVENSLGPIATREEVLACQLSSWYPTFAKTGLGKRDNVTIKSIILQLKDEQEESALFRKYLLTDGVRLPIDATKLSSCAQVGNDDGWSSEEEDDDDNNEEDDDDKEDSSEPQFSFPALNEQITDAIERLGGNVLPKLNWSAPKDATWVNGGSMKCQTAGDVYLLVKSSDFCLHDVLYKAWKDCFQDDNNDNSDAILNKPPQLQLTLRKWCNLHPNMEFRCFVRQHELVAISQRHHTQHYPHLIQDMARIRTCLLDFFETTIRHRFANGNTTIDKYIVDVYLDQKQRVWILDFNIWARSTDSLLFEWSELQTLDVEDDPHFRLVETNNQVRQDPLSSYRAPIDTVDLASMMGGDAKHFEEFMKQCQRPSVLQEEGEDEE